MGARVPDLFYTLLFKKINSKAAVAHLEQGTCCAKPGAAHRVSPTVDLVQWLLPDTFNPPLTAPFGRWTRDNRKRTAFQQSSARKNSGQGQCPPVAGSCISFCPLSDQNYYPLWGHPQVHVVCPHVCAHPA